MSHLLNPPCQLLHQKPSQMNLFTFLLRNPTQNPALYGNKTPTHARPTSGPYRGSLQPRNGPLQAGQVVALGDGVFGHVYRHLGFRTNQRS